MVLKYVEDGMKGNGLIEPKPGQCWVVCRSNHPKIQLLCWSRVPIEWGTNHHLGEGMVYFGEATYYAPYSQHAQVHLYRVVCIGQSIHFSKQFAWQHICTTSDRKNL